MEQHIIEWCFVQIKRRFSILGNKIHLERKNKSSCFVLHNGAKDLKNEYFELDDEHVEDAELINEGARVPERARRTRL